MSPEQIPRKGICIGCMIPAIEFSWEFVFEGRMTIVITIVVPHCVGGGHGKHDPRQKLHNFKDTKYDIQCDFIFGFTRYYIFLLLKYIFTK